MKRKSLSLILLLSLGFSSCRSTSSHRSDAPGGIGENTEIPTKVDEALRALGSTEYSSLSLGNGWDTEKKQKFAPCVSLANYAYRGAHTSDLTAMRDLSYDQIMQETAGALYGKASLFGLVSAKVQGEMATSLASTDDSTSYIYNFQILGKSVVLGDRSFNDTGSTAFNTNDLVRFRDLCGNQYVQQLRLGGQLYIGVKYTFTSKEVKDEISVTMSLSLFWGLIKVSKTWSKEFRELMKNVRVSVEAFQIGGDPSRLEALKNEIHTGSCAGNEPEACADAIDRLLEYGAKDFSEQLGDMTLSKEPNQGPAIIDVQLEDYAAVKIYDPKQKKAVQVSVSTSTTKDNALTNANAELDKTLINLRIAASRVKTLEEFSLNETDGALVQKAKKAIEDALVETQTLRETTCTRALKESALIDSCLAKAKAVQALAKAATVPVSLSRADL